MVNVGSGSSTVLARLDERIHQQAQRVVHAVGEQHLRGSHAEMLRQAALRCLVLRIDAQLLGRHAPQRAQRCGRAADRVLVEIEAQLARAAFFRRDVRRQALHDRAHGNRRRAAARASLSHRRTSTARLCATRPSACASAETTGARLCRPARVSCCTRGAAHEVPRRKPAARARAAAGRQHVIGAAGVVADALRRPRTDENAARRGKLAAAAPDWRRVRSGAPARTDWRIAPPQRRSARCRIAPLSVSERRAGLSGGSALSCSETLSRTSAASLREVVTSSATASGSCSACATRSDAM